MPPSDRGPQTRVPRGRASPTSPCRAVRKEDGQQRKHHDDPDGPRSTNPDRSLREQSSRGAQIADEHAKQSDLSSGVLGTASQCLLRLCSHGGDRVPIRGRAIATGAVAWAHHATRLPGVAARQRARAVEQPALRRRAVRPRQCDLPTSVAAASYARRASGQLPSSTSASHQARHACGRFVFRAIAQGRSTPSRRKTASRSQRSCSLSHSSFDGRRRPRRFTHNGRNASRSGRAPAETSSISLIGFSRLSDAVRPAPWLLSTAAARWRGASSCTRS